MVSDGKRFNNISVMQAKPWEAFVDIWTVYFKKPSTVGQSQGLLHSPKDTTLKETVLIRWCY